jgi:hypothetical protein
MNEDDFLKAFMNVDILAVEGVAEVVGRVIGKLRAGMEAAGLTAFDSNEIIISAVKAFFEAMLNANRAVGESNGEETTNG